MGQTRSSCNGHNSPCLLEELYPPLPGFNLLQLADGYRRGLGTRTAELHSQLCQGLAVRPKRKQSLGFVLPQFTWALNYSSPPREPCEA